MRVLCTAIDGWAGYQRVGQRNGSPDYRNNDDNTAIKMQMHRMLDRVSSLSRHVVVMVVYGCGCGCGHWFALHGQNNVPGQGYIL